MAKKLKESKEKEGNKDEKLAKRKARLEALKNRPAGQRPNSKQMDIIDLGNGNVIKNYGYPIKNNTGHFGILITSVLFNGDKVISNSTAFVPGNITIKVKKGHGQITTPKSKRDSKESEENEESEDSEDSED